MKRIFKYSRLFLVPLLMLFITNEVHSQKKQNIDSVLKAAKLDIYEKPDNVIKIGDSIYNSPKSSIEDKARGLILVSSAYSAKRDYQKALKHFLKASELSKKTNNIGLQIDILSRITIIYQQLKVYDKAMESLDECERLLDKHKIKDSYIKGTNYVVRGVIYKEQLSCELAIQFFNKAIEEYKKVNSADVMPNISITAYNRGNCYITVPDYKKAKESFKEAIFYAEKVKAKSLKAFAQKGLAEVYRLEGNYAEAVKELEEAYLLSKNVGDLILKRAIYEGLSINYLALNNKEKYLYYHNLFLENQLVIKNSERRAISDSIDELTRKNNQKTETLKEQYYYIIGTLIMLIIIVSFVIYTYQKRSQKSLEALKSKVEKVKNDRKNIELT